MAALRRSLQVGGDLDVPLTPIHTTVGYFEVEDRQHWSANNFPVFIMYANSLAVYGRAKGPLSAAMVLQLLFRTYEYSNYVYASGLLLHDAPFARETLVNEPARTRPNRRVPCILLSTRLPLSRVPWLNQGGYHRLHRWLSSGGVRVWTLLRQRSPMWPVCGRHASRLAKQS